MQFTIAELPLELIEVPDMDFISRLCNPVIVMAEGTVMTQGTAEEVKANEEVIDAYLGGGLKNKPGSANAPDPAPQQEAT